MGHQAPIRLRIPSGAHQAPIRLPSGSWPIRLPSGSVVAQRCGSFTRRFVVGKEKVFGTSSPGRGRAALMNRSGFFSFCFFGRVQPLWEQQCCYVPPSTGPSQSKFLKGPGCVFHASTLIVPGRLCSFLSSCRCGPSLYRQTGTCGVLSSCLATGVGEEKENGGRELSKE